MAATLDAYDTGVLSRRNWINEAGTYRMRYDFQTYSFLAPVRDADVYALMALAIFGTLCRTYRRAHQPVKCVKR